MENNGKGIFYGVIGVATLIVAIIGATFAYFSASADNSTTINGQLATAGLDLNIKQVSNGNSFMIPQTAKTIGVAVTGTSKTEYYDENADKTSGGSCIDDDGRTVCKVYEIKVANTGSTPVSLFGTLTLEADTDSDGTSKMTNLKWGLGTDATTGFGTVYGVDKTSLVNPATDTEGNYTSVYLEAKDDASTADEKTFYVVVFLDDPNRAQDTEDIGYFKGTVSFFAGDGSTGLTSTFTDYTE